MEEEHASLAKAFTTVKCRETVGYARELLGVKRGDANDLSGRAART